MQNQLSFTMARISKYFIMRERERKQGRKREIEIVRLLSCVCSKYYTPPPFCRKLLPPPPPPPRPRWQKLSCARFGDVCFAIVTFCSCTNSNTVQHGMPSLFPSFPTIAMGRSSPSAGLIVISYAITVCASALRSECGHSELRIPIRAYVVLTYVLFVDRRANLFLPPMNEYAMAWGRQTDKHSAGGLWRGSRSLFSIVIVIRLKRSFT